MDERRAYEAAIRIQEEIRQDTKDFLINAFLDEDWPLVTDAAVELRVIDARLELMKKVLECMPG